MSPLDDHLHHEWKSTTTFGDVSFRHLVEGSGDCIFVSRDMRIIYMNPAGLRLLKATDPASVLGHSPLEFFHPGVHEEIHQRVAQLMAHPTSVPQAREPMVTVTGEVVPTDVTASSFPFGDGLAILVTCRDATARAQTEEELQASEARYRLLFRQNPHPMWVYSNVNHRFLAVNPAAINRYGWSEQEFLGGMTIFDIRPEAEAQRLRADLERDNAPGKHFGLWRHQTRSGALLDVEIVSDSILWDGQDARLVLAHDVTERRKLEAQQLRTQRMESIGTLAGGVAHDLNNVLAPILMAVEMLKMDAANARVLATLETIEASARRGAGLVRQILSFTRGVEGLRVPVRLEQVMAEVISLIRQTFDRSITLEIEQPDVLWPVNGDATQLHRVLLNLAVNARDAMPGGGTLRLKAANLTKDGIPEFGVEGPEHFVALTVADTGTGIPRALQDQIFDPFFTTKEVGKGTGLGLATVQAVVESHGGHINLYSEEGKGSVFRIYLPALTTEDEIAPPTPPPTLPRGKGELILVVDDESAIRLITSHTLEVFGYRVVVAANGAEAVAIFSERRTEIALVLTDMMMPIMDGVATIKALRTIDPTIRIIAASGLSANGSVAKAATLGITDFLAKPYTVEEMVRLVAKLLGHPDAGL
jgi:PAS domain S-box-containing protein